MDVVMETVFNLFHIGSERSPDGTLPVSRCCRRRRLGKQHSVAGAPWGRHWRWCSKELCKEVRVSGKFCPILACQGVSVTQTSWSEQWQVCCCCCWSVLMQFQYKQSPLIGDPWWESYVVLPSVHCAGCWKRNILKWGTGRRRLIRFKEGVGIKETSRRDVGGAWQGGWWWVWRGIESCAANVLCPLLHIFFGTLATSYGEGCWHKACIHSCTWSSYYRTNNECALTCASLHN